MDDLPPYLFTPIDAIKAQKHAEGVDIIDLEETYENLVTAAIHPSWHRK
ncbi:MAG: hypothetical protein LBU24_02430 [Methanocalculaceae archaeon]|nr:hypothetical protein [Methanocalculaceae archaeon]